MGAVVVLAVQRGLVVPRRYRGSEEHPELAAVPCLVGELVGLVGGRKDRGRAPNSNPRRRRLQPLRAWCRLLQQ